MKAIDVWHQRQVGNVPINDVTFGNGQFASVGGKQFFTSPTGENWSSRAFTGLPSDAVVWGVAYSESLQKFVAFYNRTWGEIPPQDPAQRKSWALEMNSDGTVSRAAVNIGIRASRIVAHGDLLVAVGYGIAYSVDGGRIWHNAQSQTPIFYDEDNLRVDLLDACVGADAAGNTQWIAVGWLYPTNVSTTSGSRVFWLTSEDGITWQGHTNMHASYLDCVAYGDAAYVAGDNYDRFQYLEADTEFWNLDPFRTSGAVRGLAFGGGMFIGVGDKGYIYASSNGQSWDARVIPTRETLFGVRFCGDTFIALGANGNIFQSERCSLPFLSITLAGTIPGAVRVWTQSGLDVMCSSSTGLAIDTARWGQHIKLTGSGVVRRASKPVKIPGNGTIMIPGVTEFTFFDHWSGAATGKASTTTIVMDADKAVAAYFTHRVPKPVLESV